MKTSTLAAFTFSACAATSAPAQDSNSIEIDPKFWPIVAASQVFLFHFPNINDFKSHIRDFDENTATLGRYTVMRQPNNACVFVLRRGPEKLAAINFDQLTNRIEIWREYSNMVHVLINGPKNAICIKLGDSEVRFMGQDPAFDANPMARQPGALGCKRALEAFMPESNLPLLESTLTYIFENVCRQPPIVSLGVTPQ